MLLLAKGDRRGTVGEGGNLQDRAHLPPRFERGLAVKMVVNI